VLEIVEREALGLSSCLAFGESFYAAMSGSIFFRGGGLALVESGLQESPKQLNCLDEFAVPWVLRKMGQPVFLLSDGINDSFSLLSSARSLDQKLS